VAYAIARGGELTPNSYLGREKERKGGCFPKEPRFNRGMLITERRGGNLMRRPSGKIKEVGRL